VQVIRVELVHVLMVTLTSPVTAQAWTTLAIFVKRRSIIVSVILVGLVHVLTLTLTSPVTVLVQDSLVLYVM
jgi:hypothetical protein